MSEAHKKWIKRHPGYGAEKQREWIKRHPNYQKEYWQKNSQRCVFHHAKERAKKCGIPFTIKYEDIIIPKKCPYLNIILRRGKGYHCPTSPSLDRIDSSKGYVPGNIQVISYKANEMKSNATKKQLTTFAKNILQLINNT